MRLAWGVLTSIWKGIGSFARPRRGLRGLSETTLSQFWHLTLAPLMPNGHFCQKCWHLSCQIDVLVGFRGITRICLHLGWTCRDWKDLEGFWIKISLRVSKTIKIQTFLLEIVVFPGKKPPEAAFFGSHILVCSQDTCCVCSQDICIDSSEDICIVSSEDICIVTSQDIGILSHLNDKSYDMRAAVPSACCGCWEWDVRECRCLRCWQCRCLRCWQCRCLRCWQCRCHRCWQVCGWREEMDWEEMDW